MQYFSGKKKFTQISCQGFEPFILEQIWNELYAMSLQNAMSNDFFLMNDDDWQWKRRRFFYDVGPATK